MTETTASITTALFNLITSSCDSVVHLLHYNISHWKSTIFPLEWTNDQNYYKKITPRFLLNWYYQFLPVLGALIYRFPSKKLNIIGVTGTNGKSSTVELITSIFQEADIKVASITSIRFQINDNIWKNKLRWQCPEDLRYKSF